MHFRERQNNTAEQTEQYLGDALALVERLAPPDDLREACFTTAANLLSSKQIIAEQPSPLMSIPQNARH